MTATNWNKLVHPAWLHEQIGRRNPLAGHTPDLLVIEAGEGTEAAYQQEHLPGAIFLDTNAIERPPAWNVIPDDELEETLCAHGITHRRLAVLYGRDPIAVARVAWVLMYAGVEDVRWLAGGVEAWQTAGYELEAGIRPPSPAASFGLKIPAHTEYLSDLAQTRAALASDKGVVVCTRSWEEYDGQVSGYDYFQAKGRIPGSVWAGFPYAGLRPVENSRSVEDTARLCQALAADWQAKGITPDKKIVFYCGTGWRASEAFFYAHLMGWQDICVYDGGWLEWSNYDTLFGSDLK